MRHEPRDIIDRVALGDDVFTIEEVDGEKFRLIPSPDSVEEHGTLVNKELMQPWEDHLGTWHADEDAFNNIAEASEISQDTKNKFGFSTTPVDPEDEVPPNLDDILSVLGTSLWTNISNTTMYTLNTIIGESTEISRSDVSTGRYVKDANGTIAIGGGYASSTTIYAKTVGRVPKTIKTYKHDIKFMTTCNAYTNMYGSVYFNIEILSSSIPTISGFDAVADLLRNGKYISSRCDNFALSSDRYIRTKAAYSCGAFSCQDFFFAVPTTPGRDYIVMRAGNCNQSVCLNYSNYSLVSVVTSSI